MKLTNLVIAPGERFDTIVDFTGMKPGSTLTLMNNANAPYPGGEGGEVLEIMQFKLVPRVGKDTHIIAPVSKIAAHRSSTNKTAEIKMERNCDLGNSGSHYWSNP